MGEEVIRIRLIVNIQGGRTILTDGDLYSTIDDWLVLFERIGNSTVRGEGLFTTVNNQKVFVNGHCIESLSYEVSVIT